MPSVTAAQQNLGHIPYRSTKHYVAGRIGRGNSPMVTELELEVHKSLMRKLAAKKAAATRKRRSAKVEWINPLSTAIEIHGRKYIPYRQAANRRIV